MSITRARWSDNEKKAVLDAYGAATDADEFFEFVKNALGTAYFRRTVKAYLTFLNDNLLPKTDPRRPVYQSLCEANQKEIAATKAAEEAAKIAAQAPVAPVPVTVTPASTATPATPDFNWVTKEVDVVPRVPPGRAAPPSLFRDPNLPTLNEALATQAAERAAQTPRPVVTPDPKALVPRHYPSLPVKDKITADELAQVFGLHRTKVVDAFAYGFIQTLDGSHISYQTAQRVHDAMSEGHSFSEACRLVNPNSSGLLPMEALIEPPPVSGGYVSPIETVENQPSTVIPGFDAGKVALRVGEWEVKGGPMNSKSVDKMATDLNTQGLFVAPVEVPSGPPSLFQGGEVFPVAQSVEVPAEPPKTVVNNPVEEIVLDEIHAGPPAPTVPEVQPGSFERYTLEAVRDGVLTTAQGVDILAPRDTHKAIWALSLLASGKITVVQCDRLLYAKSV